MLPFEYSPNDPCSMSMLDSFLLLKFDISRLAIVPFFLALYVYNQQN